MESQETLLSMLGHESVIDAVRIPPNSSIEQILDNRDSEQFSQQWMAAFNLVESHKDEMNQSQSELSTQIREAAYLRAYARWKSPDLAAYISDDFGLIADSAALCIDEPRIEAMLRSYRNGVIPSSPY